MSYVHGNPKKGSFLDEHGIHIFSREDIFI